MAASESKTPKIIFGTGTWGSSDSPLVDVTTPDQAKKFLDILRNNGVTNLDTSRAYPLGAPGTSEALLGQIKAPDSFTIDSKVISNDPGHHKSARVAESVDASLQALGVKKVDIMFLHWPDRTVPFTEPLVALNEAYKQGKFERFGLSNYSASEVEEIIQICEKEGYVKPTVYQGQYNALCRRGEKQLFPTLRAKNMAFHAYSPAAGGALNAGSSRAANKTLLGELTRAWYGGNKKALAAEAAQKHNMTGHELALRWVLYHSAIDYSLGDAVIVGASRSAQLEETLQMIKKGPLPEDLVKAVDDIWEAVEPEATSYSPWVDTEGKAFSLPISEISEKDVK